MSTLWLKRKARLGTLLQSSGDEDEDGLALDRILHGQSVIGKTSKTIEVDKLRFTDKDLSVVGTLEYGQFAIVRMIYSSSAHSDSYLQIDVVNCNVDGRVYVRKSIEKRFAFKSRDQCNPQLEREILLRALRTDSVWAPHLLCAFQTGTHLNLVMDYAEGGTLWDVLESSPLEHISEGDLRWWLPQIISAVAWCHSQGFVHRDIKPHNFVLTRSAHVQLIDFGSAAPLMPGSRLIASEHCRVPCGTCDYISPEILHAHEAALVALEMSDEEDAKEGGEVEGGYGVETDWWSMGAMLYEMTYGVAPFFARDIRSTYLKIIDFKKSLKFQANVPVSNELRDLVQGLLTDAESRLGRRTTKEVMYHPFFEGVMWEGVQSESHPPDLHLPLFTYNEDLSGLPAPRNPDQSQERSSSISTPFAFSAFFQPSEDGSTSAHSVLRGTPRSILREDAESFFIGFSWGPAADAFPDTPVASTAPEPYIPMVPKTPARTASAFATPMRPMATLPRASTLRRTRTAPRRAVSDREAMRQLVDCIGLSARKKVLAAGRTPRTALASAKTIRFAQAPAPLDFGKLASGESGHDSDSSTGVGFVPDASEDESDGVSVSDAPPSPSPSPRPGSAMSMLSRRSATPTASLSLRFSRDAQDISVIRLNGTPTTTRMTLLPNALSTRLPQSSHQPEGDEDALDALEERYRALMGDIASIEGRMGVMRRRTLG
ncbi:kinase-like domain-containing protein [Gloeopeniophorella convolvens]|nr:kinase-like domain-containing protein [Gloeopeniophorella convolvens]